MKKARAWADQIFGCGLGTADINDIRRIQADALRYAANLSGVLHRVTVLDDAERLERIASGTASLTDREIDQLP